MFIDEFQDFRKVKPSFFSVLQGLWDRKGEQEIDIIAEDEVDGRMLVAEVKRDGRRGNVDALKEKFDSFRRTCRVDGKTAVEFKILSMSDM